MWKSVNFRTWISGCFSLVPLVSLGSRQSPELTFFYCYLLQWRSYSEEKCKKSDGFRRWKGLLSVELTLPGAGSSSDGWSLVCCAEKLRGTDVRIKQCARNGFLRHLLSFLQLRKGFYRFLYSKRLGLPYFKGFELLYYPGTGEIF